MFKGNCGGDSRNRPNRVLMEDNFSMDRDKHKGGRSGFRGSSLVGSDEPMVGTCVPTNNGGSAVVGTCGSADKDVRSSGFNVDIGDECALTQPDAVSRGGTNHGDSELARMDFEGGGQVDASF